MVASEVESDELNSNHVITMHIIKVQKSVGGGGDGSASLLAGDRDTEITGSMLLSIMQRYISEPVSLLKTPGNHYLQD